MKNRFMQTASTDRRLVDYILGTLPEADAEALDEATIVDDAMAARLRAVEDDLVDAYVRGQLTGDTLLRFERHYLQSARRRDKVAFARNFIRAVDRAAAAAPVATPVGLSRPFIWKLASVAAVLTLACAGLVWQTVRLGRGITVVEQQRAALDRRAHDLQQQVTDLRAARQLAPPRPVAPPSAADVPPIALLLMPQTRSGGDVPTLVVPPRVPRVTFELRLDAAAPTTYQAGLRDPAVNRIIWRSGWLATSGSSLTVSVPTSVLKPQHYSIDLLARDANADGDVAASYAFEIAAR